MSQRISLTRVIAINWYGFGSSPNFQVTFALLVMTLPRNTYCSRTHMTAKARCKSSSRQFGSSAKIR